MLIWEKLFLAKCSFPPIVQALEKSCCQKNAKKRYVSDPPATSRIWPKCSEKFFSHHLGCIVSHTVISVMWYQYNKTKAKNLIFENFFTSFLHLPSNDTEGNGLKNVFLVVGFISKNIIFSQELVKNAIFWQQGSLSLPMQSFYGLYRRFNKSCRKLFFNPNRDFIWFSHKTCTIVKES